MDPWALQDKPVAAESPAKDPVGDGSKVDFQALSPYRRSLLRIKVPVAVTLAAQKMSVRKIVEIVPGTILQFDKSCEEPLDLEAGSQRIAQGECVKVGDKFALRITAMTLPAERLVPIRT
jgi:flagellar motor switch protein FliN/FliY